MASVEDSLNLQKILARKCLSGVHEAIHLFEDIEKEKEQRWNIVKTKATTETMFFCSILKVWFGYSQTPSITSGWVNLMFPDNHAERSQAILESYVENY